MLNRHAVPVVSLMKTRGLRDSLLKGKRVMARVAIVKGGTRRIGRAISGDMVCSVPPAVLEKIVARIPVGRLVSPWTLRARCCFLSPIGRLRHRVNAFGEWRPAHVFALAE